MVKQRAGRSTAGSSASGGGSAKSDVEILAERKRLETFSAADTLLKAISWGSWVLAGLWFLVFGDAAVEHTASSSVFVRCFAYTPLQLFVCGILTGRIATSAPKCAQWSWWRKPWHVLWIVTLGILTLSFAREYKAAESPPGGATFAGWAALACMLLTATAAFTCPSGPPLPVKECSAPYGKLILCSLGFGGGLLVADIVLSTTWTRSFAALNGAAAACCIAMCVVAFVCAQTEAELLAAVTAAIVLFAGSLFGGILHGELIAILLASVALLLLATLFLPLPVKDPTSNPFHVALRRIWGRFTRLLSDPVSGFGDSAD
eukprot:TRINITY_DN73511_c0_g1_i1.p1 TRINITY_DN73511_c0_g1~~TRINITY_DN73511_c0_g1_i1.p1  ORF type:complete len:318 (-),score=68.89 TRINITY_DN73511_c0_g1_i1:34-987(-)